ncbi:MAG: DUF222 domain-containing protein [Acidothermaceae bacterium]
MFVGAAPFVDPAALAADASRRDDLSGGEIALCDGELLDVEVCDGDDPVAGWWLDLEPGPTAMAVLGGIDPARLDRAGRVAYMTAWDRQNSWLNAQIQAATVAVAGPEPTTEDDWARDEIGVALKMSARAVQQRVHLARMLIESLPGTQELLASGQISMRHALAMVELCAPVPAAVLSKVEARVLGKAPNQSVASFRRSVRRAIIALAPAAADEAHEFAREQRDVVMMPEPNGMATVIATLTATEARGLFQAVDALARGRHQAAGGRKSGVGIGQRRADALVALADAALADRRLPKTHGRPVELQIMIDVPTLLHLAENPAELIGYGPIPPQMARDLAGRAAWRRLVIDPVDGHLLDYGRRTYRPPKRLADYISARDRTCRVPGCQRPAILCDADHVIPFGNGGPTSSDNCVSLCRRHHRLKTMRRWKLVRQEDGRLQVVTAAGIAHDLPIPDQRDP